MKIALVTKNNRMKLLIASLLLVGAFNIRANSNFHGNTKADFISDSGYSDFSLIFQNSVTRWNPISNANISFGRMTMYENRNSSKITWKSGQNSAYETVSDDEDGTVIRLLSAPNFDGDRCRYLKMVFNEDSVTVDFYSTKKALDANSFFMEGSYEKVK